jgi:drug/metabolite transporter (DMT)-like permease
MLKAIHYSQKAIPLVIEGDVHLPDSESQKRSPKAGHKDRESWFFIFHDCLGHNISHRANTTPPSRPLSGAAPPAASSWAAQVGVAATQAAFVTGSVVLKASLSQVDASKGEIFSPIVFAFLREACAGPLLYILALRWTGVAWPQRQDASRVTFIGACLFLSQLLYIKGLHWSGALAASCMQPAIPVFTALGGILLGMEPAKPRKLAGIALAVVGAVCMVIGGASQSHPQQQAVTEAEVLRATAADAAEASRVLLGNACLVVNTAAMAGYYLVGKGLVGKYPPVAVAAWAYLVGEPDSDVEGVSLIFFYFFF